MKLRDFFHVNEGVYPSSKDPNKSKADKEDRLTHPEYYDNSNAPEGRWDKIDRDHASKSRKSESIASFRGLGRDPYRTPAPKQGECPECQNSGFALNADGQYDECPNCTDPQSGGVLPQLKWKSSRTPQDDASDAAEAQRWKYGIDDSFDPNRQKPKEYKQDRDDDDRKNADWNKRDEEQGLADWEKVKKESAGEGKWPGNTTFEDPSANPKEFDNIEQWEQDVWDYAQERYGWSAAKLNSPKMSKEMDSAFETDVPPEDFVDELSRESGMEESRSSNSGPGKLSNEPEKSIGKRDWEKTQSKDSRAQAKRSTGFTDKDPADDMFFGSQDEDDMVGTITDPASGEDFKGKKVDDFGDDALDGGFFEPGEDTQSIWNQQGFQDAPGADVSFPSPATQEDDPEMFEPETRKGWNGSTYATGKRVRKQYEPPKDTGRKGAGDDLNWAHDIKMWEK